VTHPHPHTDEPNEEITMKRTPVNPWSWSQEMGFNQAEILEGHRRELVVAGQTAMSADGEPQHPDDMAAQLTRSLDNLEAVLAAAGMALSDVVRLNIYTTDVDTLFEHYGTLAERLGAAGIAPPGSLLGVTRLAFPGLLVELEATAAD
jgi:enamine deaminase RidA (YjgF/YER057c/UK114 family)